MYSLRVYIKRWRWRGQYPNVPQSHFPNILRNVRFDQSSQYHCFLLAPIEIGSSLKKLTERKKNLFNVPEPRLTKNERTISEMLKLNLVKNEQVILLVAECTVFHFRFSYYDRMNQHKRVQVTNQLTDVPKWTSLNKGTYSLLSFCGFVLLLWIHPSFLIFGNIIYRSLP